MMSRELHIGFGRSDRPADPGLPALTSLVDILMATIGIFVIVFALQEVVSTPPLVPAPYDALAFCRDAGTVAIYSDDKSGGPSVVSVEGFTTALNRLVPNGGRLMLGVTRACVQADAKGSAPVQRLIDTLEQANTLAPNRTDPLHIYEVVPLGDGAFSEPVLVERWHIGSTGSPR